MSRNFFSTVALFGMLILAGCGKNTPIMQNEYLSSLPSLEKKYSEQFEQKQQEIKQCTDLDKASQLGKELESLKDEWEKAVKDLAASAPFKKTLPFEPLPSAPYTIKEIVVNHVNKGNLNLKFSGQINQDIKNEFGNYEKNLSIYFLALDQNGQEIPGSATAGMNDAGNRNELKAGIDQEFFGGWNSSDIKNLENFAKIKMIGKEEYEQKKQMK